MASERAVYLAYSHTRETWFTRELLLGIVAGYANALAPKNRTCLTHDSRPSIHQLSSLFMGLMCGPGRPPPGWSSVTWAFASLIVHCLKSRHSKVQHQLWRKLLQILDLQEPI